MQNAAGNHWLSFVNSTSWSPLSGTATLFNGLGNSSIGATSTDSQFIITVPQIEVVDIVMFVSFSFHILRLTDTFPFFPLDSFEFFSNNYDDGDHPVCLTARIHQDPLSDLSLVFSSTYSWSFLVLEAFVC